MTQCLRSFLATIKPEYWLLITNGKNDVPAEILHLPYVAPTLRTIADYQRSEQSGRRFDVGVVWYALPRSPGCLSFNETRLLARLRDLDTKRLVVCASPVCSRDLIALGFTRVPLADVGEDDDGLFIYDIANYKKTPDWLNSQHWANPERWDMARW